MILCGSSSRLLSRAFSVPRSIVLRTSSTLVTTAQGRQQAPSLSYNCRIVSSSSSFGGAGAGAGAGCWNSFVTRSHQKQQQQEQHQATTRTVRFLATTVLEDGSFEFDESAGPLYRADRVLANRMKDVSRSTSFDLLKQKRIFLIMDDEEDRPMWEREWRVVPGPSTKIPEDAPLILDRTHVIPPLPPLLQVYHKPKWVLSVRRDPRQRKCLDESILPGMHPVGRLDYDSSGLLLFASDGQITQRILHPKHQISKQYLAVVTGTVDATVLSKQFTQGVQTTEGTHTAQLISVEHYTPGQVKPYLESIQSAIPAAEYDMEQLKTHGYLDVFDATALSTVQLIVHEGKHRMVRRMLANCGHAVVTLIRQKIGEIELGNLPPGQHRPLTAEELVWAKQTLLNENSNKNNNKNKKPKYIAKKRRETLERRAAGENTKAQKKAPPKKKKEKPDPVVDQINSMIEDAEAKYQAKLRKPKRKKYYPDPRVKQVWSDKTRKRKRRERHEWQKQARLRQKQASSSNGSSSKVRGATSAKQ